MSQANRPTETTLRALADLPNRRGFEFVGIDHDGNRIRCIVDLDPIGCHAVYTQDGHDPCFFRLAGWVPT